MTYKICLSILINDDDVGGLIERVTRKKPDLVEFRLDNLRDTTIVEAIAKKKTFPAIATDKSTKESTLKRNLLLSAADAGFDFVDIDLVEQNAESTIEAVKSRGTQAIVSFHDMIRTPSLNELNEILESQKRIGADVCKIVSTALDPHDNLRVLDFVGSHSVSTRLVSFAMGSMGTASRILSPLFGAEFTFAAIDEGSTTAQGQLTIDDLRTVWRLLGIH